MRMKGTETRELPCSLSKDELFQRADRLSWQMKHRTELEADHKARKETMKRETEDCDGSIASLTKVLRNRAEDRTVECQVFLDDEKGKAFVVRMDTGEVVNARDMWESEKQLDFSDHDPISEALQQKVDDFFERLLEEEKPAEDASDEDESEDESDSEEDDGE